MERLPLARSLDAVREVLPERGTVLEAVSRAAADEPPVGAVGMPVGDEVRVPREVVLADPGADDRRCGKRRKSLGGVAPRLRLRLRRREALERVRVDLVA